MSAPALVRCRRSAVPNQIASSLLCYPHARRQRIGLQLPKQQAAAGRGVVVWRALSAALYLGVRGLRRALSGLGLRAAVAVGSLLGRVGEAAA